MIYVRIGGGTVGVEEEQKARIGRQEAWASDLQQGLRSSRWQVVVEVNRASHLDLE